jgi:hypothetical protein
MDQAKTGFRDMGFDDSKVEAISAHCHPLFAQTHSLVDSQVYPTCHKI